VLQRPIETTPLLGMWLLALQGSRFPHSDNAVHWALCLGLSLKSCIALPRMCLGHNVKIANITDLSELEVGNPENDN
jgi:hypothetical protein